MRKKGLERYLIISSIALCLVIIASFIVTLSSQGYQVLNQVEYQTHGLIELDDWFDDIFD